MSAVNYPVSGRRRRESLVGSFKDRVVINGSPKFCRPFRLPVPATLTHDVWMLIVLVELEGY